MPPGRRAGGRACRCGSAAFQRRSLVLRGTFRTRGGDAVDRMEATVVTPRACPDCEGGIDLAHRLERGVKCETVKARITCRDYARDISFCLPVPA